MTSQAAEGNRALAALADSGVDHASVRTTPATSAEESASFQGIELNQLLKTLVIRKAQDDHVFVLVPADREIDWKKLRAVLGVSRASIPSREEAEQVTGYSVGTITPFGSKTALPVFLDEAALEHPLVALGAGERGLNVHISPAALRDSFGASIADFTALRSQP